LGVFVGAFFKALVGTLVGVPGAEVPVLRVSVGSSNMSDGSDDGVNDGSDDGLSLGCLNIR